MCRHVKREQQNKVSMNVERAERGWGVGDACGCGRSQWGLGGVEVNVRGKWQLRRKNRKKRGGRALKIPQRSGRAESSMAVGGLACLARERMCTSVASMCCVWVPSVGQKHRQMGLCQAGGLVEICVHGRLFTHTQLVCRCMLVRVCVCVLK